MSDDETLRAIAEEPTPFGELLGVRILSVTRDRLEAELPVVPRFANRNGVMHGGAIMAFADYLGGTATVMTLPHGMMTTTIESKTNFFSAIPLGETARGICTLLHGGRSTMVWQTELLRQNGRRAALVIQTQILLPRRSGTTPHQ